MSLMLNSIEHLAFKLVGLAGSIWVAEKTNIINSFVDIYNDSKEVQALKMSAFLSASEYVGDFALSRVIGVTTPRLYNDAMSFGWAFVSNGIVLYAFEKLSIDDKIITASTPEMRAVQLAILFILVQETSHFLLNYLHKFYY